MRTLKNHVILFDADCPICGAYTKLFVNTGMLEKGGRAAYQEVDAGICPLIDRQRAVNEIALVNQETGEVTYGIHSLFKLFSTAIPFLGPLFRWAPFIWLMSRLYAFISYNRRVIVPPKEGVESFDLKPNFRLGYRIAYLTLTWFLTAAILTRYAVLLASLIPNELPLREYLICAGQIMFQGVVITLINYKERWDYLGNMMTISIAGALLLLPVLVLSSLVQLSPVICAAWFLFVAGLMFLEHLRRTRLLGVGHLASVSWVSYRILVLLIILLVH